ncbi:mothers against decapentaplegic homolog 6-like [Anneissia japonica]|uniref:mothers against decapentaplegic homolog 6-like n=1 Tax=Anneissia japonica TaxID=1529436 RepID=UPI00142582EC|nr:mothers against decapentaplegic homolog 6-like [Anneissia japonica]
MFRSKRTNYVRRLWRNRATSSTDSEEQRPSKLVDTQSSDFERDLRAASHVFLKRLKEKQLELLLEAVESKGGAATACALLPRGELKIGHTTLSPEILCCLLFRWPDLQNGSELRRLTHTCKFNKDSPESAGYVCCNPYHLSRLAKTPESAAPPPYSEVAWDWKALQHTSRLLPLRTCSTETGNTPTSRLHHWPQSDVSALDGEPLSPWCSIAYWENRTRVGRMFSVLPDFVNIFYELPHGDGFCLGQLQTESRSENVIRTRTKIGYGLVLSKDRDGVWIYNRSNYALFINSPTLDDPQSRTLTVVKLLPGFSIKAFDYTLAEILEVTRTEPDVPIGPTDSNSLRISFVKGWGGRYSRQHITSCPCWVEIILSVPR